MRTFLVLLTLLSLAPLASAQRPILRGGTVTATPSRTTFTPPPPSLDTGDYRYVYSPYYGTPTSRSGNSGSFTMRGDRRDPHGDDSKLGSTSPIYAIEIGERGDKPCYVKAYYSKPGSRANVESGGNGSTTFEMCGSGGVSSSSIRRAGPTTSPLARQRPAVRGLRVCSNDRRGNAYRVKGIEIRMGEVNEADGGSVTSSGARGTARQRHCREWEPLRMCPAGQVVVSLSIDYNRSASGDPVEITGITPRCAELERVEADNDDGCRASGAC